MDDSKSISAGRPLTAQQQRFVEAYLIDLNGTDAAIRAGYSARTAAQQASRLLTNAKVKSAIDAAMDARSERLEITQDYVLEELWRLAKKCAYGVPVVGDDGKTTGLSRYEPSAAIRAFELVGKHLGMFGEFNYDASAIAKMTDDELAAARRRFKLLQ